MIPMSQRPAGYLLTVEDLTEAVFWAKSLSGLNSKAQIPFQYLIQFKLAELDNEEFKFLPTFYEWLPKLGDTFHSVDIQNACVWVEWEDE